MAFAGASLIANGELCGLSASPIDAGADRGYHLLHIEGYWGSKAATPNGEYIESRPFLVGGHRFHLEYYPNGFREEDEEFISVFVVLEDALEGQEVKAQAVFSFIDEPEMRTSTRISENEIPPQFCYFGHERFIRRNILESSGHLKNGSFIIRCDIVVVKTPADADTDKGASFVEMPFSDMQGNLSDLLVSKVGSDITFEVGGETFAAHRCVLAARSTVFKELLFGDTTMTKTNVIEINDIEPQIFQNLLVFIYTDSFPDGDWIEDGEEDESGEEEREEEIESGEGEEKEETESGEEEEDAEYVTWLLQLLEAADRYGLQRLKSICAQELVGYICRNRVADIIVVAEQKQCPRLKDLCVEYIKSHSSVYTVLTAESLDQIMRTCSPSVLKELISKFEL
ncbi:unnamed protein product [Alopecurus aequalis]